MLTALSAAVSDEPDSAVKTTIPASPTTTKSSTDDVTPPREFPINDPISKDSLPPMEFPKDQPPREFPMNDSIMKDTLPPMEFPEDQSQTNETAVKILLNDSSVESSNADNTTSTTKVINQSLS